MNLLEKINQEIENLDVQDAAGHLWWFKFKDMVEGQRVWISINDKLPKDETKVVVLVNGDTPIITFYKGSNWFTDNTNWVPESSDLFDVTHWMPLP